MAWPSVAVVDNFDSFTYNLVHYLEMITGKTPAVFRNHELPEKIKNYEAILFSPGPGLPFQAGNMMDMLREFSGNKKILGVCLGHQAIGEFFGAKLINLPEVLHGISRKITHFNNSKLFFQLPEEIITGHYHSWIISRENFPDELEITARDSCGNIMAVAHRKFDINGIQFHPESVLTPAGLKLLENWIKK
jgi:anthranilate synthase component 2